MPVLNMEVPINTEAYYRGETIARREGVSLYDKFAQWLNEYIEDADDAAALNDAMEKDDGTRYTSKQLREDLGSVGHRIRNIGGGRVPDRRLGFGVIRVGFGDSPIGLTAIPRSGIGFVRGLRLRLFVKLREHVIAEHHALLRRCQQQRL